MKVLCLHGRGINGTIMEEQFVDFIAGLDPSYEFIFLDGDLECPKAHGLPNHFQGPFYKFYNALEAEEMREACDLVQAVVDEEGPFDGFIGFSQGSSVGLSYMMDLEINHPDKPPPFKWAVFFACSLAFSPDPNFMEKELSDWDQTEGSTTRLSIARGTVTDAGGKSTSSRLPSHKIGMLLSDNKRRAFAEDMVRMVKSSLQLAKDHGIDIDDIEDVEQDLQSGKKGARSCPRIYHSLLTTERLHIPTVHCVGKQDFQSQIEQSEWSKNLCDQKLCTYYEHSGGHDLPRDPRELAIVLQATKKAIEESRWVAPRL